jgi:peptidoglycan/LPS O-acetylase OafA/YrhL
LPIQRPTWLPNYLPELDGVRGLAILWVVLYHCSPRLVGTFVHYASLWGWAGVILFFCLSGFLITSILLTTRDKPKYFHNFHARRALRIWPVYLLVLAFVYLNAPWFIGPSVWDAVRTAPWWAYLLFLQNLFHLALPPALGPTWALAIEEQYYFVWAPLVRWVRAPLMLTLALVFALIVSPWLRLGHHAWLTPTHTLIHLDGIAWGSLLAIGIHTLRWSRRLWLGLGLGGFVAGIAAAATIAGGTAFLDSALAVGFAGLVLALIASTGARNPAKRPSAQRPAGLLRPHQLRPLYDSHLRLHLLRLVRSENGPLRHPRQSRGRCLPHRCMHGRRSRAVVRLRIADPQIEAAFLTDASSIQPKLQ